MKGSEISNKKIKFNYSFSKKEGHLIRGELRRQTEKLNGGIQVNHKPNQNKKSTLSGMNPPQTAQWNEPPQTAMDKPVFRSLFFSFNFVSNHKVIKRRQV